MDYKMLVAVCGTVGKTSLINRIKSGTFSVRHTPTHFTEVHKVSMGGRPVAFVETKDVIRCDVALILCRYDDDIIDMWRAYSRVTRLPPVVVYVGETRVEAVQSYPDSHYVSNLTTHGISKLICCLYIKSRYLYK